MNVIFSSSWGGAASYTIMDDEVEAGGTSVLSGAGGRHNDGAWLGKSSGAGNVLRRFIG